MTTRVQAKAPTSRYSEVRAGVIRFAAVSSTATDPDRGRSRCRTTNGFRESLPLRRDAVKSGADAAIPGLAVTDTIKRVSLNGTDTVVEETVSRENLVTVQTPQAFRREVLVRAHEKSSDATDDAALVEALGGRVVVVPGEVQNIKITQPGDVERVETFVRSSL